MRDVPKKPDGWKATFPIPFKKLKSEADQDSETSPDEKADLKLKQEESQ